MGFHGEVEQRIESMAGSTITWSLLMVAVLLILVALFVKNNWYKAAILAWVVLP